MSKNRVKVYPGILGGWLVVVHVGNDELMRNVGRGISRPLHHQRGPALRAAHRIGKALGLPVEVKA